MSIIVVNLLVCFSSLCFINTTSHCFPCCPVKYYIYLALAFATLKVSLHISVPYVTFSDVITFRAQLFERRLALTRVKYYRGLLSRASFSFPQKHSLRQFSIFLLEH